MVVGGGCDIYITSLGFVNFTRVIGGVSLKALLYLSIGLYLNNLNIRMPF